MSTLPFATLAAVQSSPLDAIVHAAGQKLLGLRMTRIVGEPDKTDADNLRDDLEALWTIIDPVVLAIGRYAQDNLGVSGEDITRHFTDQLRGALEGNATYCLEVAGEEADAELHAAERSDFEEHNTHNRALAGV